MHKKSLVIRSRMGKREKNLGWWSKEKNLDWAIQDKKGDWWLVSGSEFPEKRVSQKSPSPNKMFNVSTRDGSYLTQCVLAAALGVSLAVNIILFLFF